MPARAAYIAAACAALVIAGQAHAAEKTSWLTALWDSTSWDVSSGFDYSTGRYGGTADTTTLSVPLNLRVQVDHVRIEGSLSYVEVTGPGTYTGGVVVGGSTAMSTRSGVGDATAGAAWLVRADDAAFPAIELAGSVKIQTASDDLGTGKFDYSAFANFYHVLSPEFMLFGSAGYQWLSDFGTVELEDGVMASAGLNYKPVPALSIGVAGAYRQEYFDGLGEQVTASPYVVWSFNQNWRVSAYGLVGFTDASPDAGGGLRIIFAQ